MSKPTDELGDIAAEEALLGSCLLSDVAIEASMRIVEPADFRKPRNGQIYARILEQYAQHGRVDIVTVASDLGSDAMDYVHKLLNATPSIGGAAQYATKIAGWKLKRELVERAAQINELAWSGIDAAEAADMARSLLQGLDMPVGRGAPDRDVDTFIASVDTEYDWLIPDFLERRDRMLVTAGEGAGKSVLLAQIAVMAAAGVHPWTLQRIPPRNVTVIDLENPERLMTRRYSWIRRNAPEDFDPMRLRLNSRADGIDLTTRTDRRWLIERCESNAADLLVIGPLYRMSAGVAAKGDVGGEDAARQITKALDEVRMRCNVALVMETHAPHANGFGRDLRPFGSSVWLRWPEFGIGIRRHPDAPENDKNRFVLEHWRGPRDQRTWPGELLKNAGRWPWTPAAMPTGTFRKPAA